MTSDRQPFAGRGPWRLRQSLLLLVVMPLLSACSNAPEQPTDGPQREAEPIGTGADAAAETTDDELSLSEVPEPVAAAAAPTDLFGGWAVDVAACGTEAPVSIDSDSYTDLAGSCEISEIVDNGDGFTASMTCDRGGASAVELLKLTPDGDTLTLDWVARDEPQTVLVRCE